MQSLVISELCLQPLLHGTLDASSCSCIRQEIDGIAEKEIVAGHGCAAGDVLHLQAVGQCARTVNLHPVVKYEDTDGRIPVQRAVDECIYYEFDQAAIRNLESAGRIELLSYLHIFKITGKKCHDSLKLMQQVSLHIRIIHFVPELLASDAVADEADAFGRHDRQPALGVFAEQQHSGYSQTAVWPDKMQIVHQLVHVVPLGDGVGNVIKRHLA